MSLNRTAKGIVLVPSVLLGGAFLAAAAWGDGAAASNKGLALALGGVLIGGGLLAQLLPEQADSPEQLEGDSLNAEKLRNDPLNAEKQGDSGEGA
jgi:predicted phage tail protein